MPLSRLLPVLIGCLVLAGCRSPEAAPTDAGTDTGSAAPDTAAPQVDAETDTPDAAPSRPGADLRPGCNRLAQEYDCLLPFPSDEFRGSDGRVTLGEPALPVDKFRAAVDAFGGRAADGFAVYPSIVFAFEDGLDPQSLVPPTAADVSTTAQSPTLLIEADTGTAVPHFSEVHRSTDTALQLGAIRPLGRLREGTRYVVALQNVRRHDGGAVRAPAVFAAMRDRVAVAPEIADLAARYEAEIFAPLDEFGVAREALDLAWDFTTRSREDLTGDMFAVRRGTLDWLATHAPTVTITQIAEGEELGANLVAHTYRHIEGTFTAPLWTTQDAPGAPLAEAITGEIEVPFTVTIPKSVAADATRRPARVIHFGHGFFGRRDEVVSAVQSEFGDELGVVMGAVDWYGMMRDDRDWVVNKITEDPRHAFGFVPRVHQGMANQLVFSHVLQNTLVGDPAVAIEGLPAYDPTQLHFVGISQGHILGGTFLALSPAIERGVLNVGGAAFSFILTRSFAFLIFERLLAQWLEPRELLKFEALAPQVLEVIDPIAYAPFVVTEPLPGNPAKQVLLQGGLGDTAVPTVAIELHARALGIPLVTPSAATVPFLPTAQAPTPSGLVLVDFGIDAELGRGWAPANEDTVAHEGVRRFGPVREQIDRFLRPGGQIEDTCLGPCVVP